MALITCNECGNGVSDKALTCPKCGAPVEKTNLSATAQKISKRVVKPREGLNEQTAKAEPERRKSPWKLIAIILIICMGLIFFVMMQSNGGIIPGIKMEVNLPAPVVISSRADAANSTLIKLKETVYATIQNQGGDGNVLVTFLVSQGGNDYQRLQSVYMKSNESIDLKETFTEVKVLDGQITYDVAVRAE